MDIYELKVLESLLVLLAFFLVKAISKKAIDKAKVKFDYHQSRIKIIKKVLNTIVTLVMVVLFLIIWGVNQSKLFLFISSFLTVLGVAFFAQWSILSNVTATLILFFNHRVKIGDHISIAEKDSQIEGWISDIGLFFVIIKTVEKEEIIIPSNIFIQKAIKKVSQ